MNPASDAKRIISLLPGATEWVCQLGLADRLVGISHECDFPDLVTGLPRVTRSKVDASLSSREIDDLVTSFSDTRTPLYELNETLLRSLKPDLILTQNLCNVCAVNERDVLRCTENLEQKCLILDLPARSMEDVMTDAREIWKATGTTRVGASAIETLDQRVARVHDTVARRLSCDRVNRPSVTLLEWLDPLYCSGHWTPQLIEWAGGIDPIGQTGKPSRVLTWEELTKANPNILLVACCGMDEERTRSEMDAVLAASPKLDDVWHGLQAVRGQHVHFFDGSAFFNRPGPRLIDTLEKVAELVAAWDESQA